MAAPNSSAGWLERLFKLSDNKTTFRTEVLAGVTTFLTMCYIIIVNPLILSETGMDHGAVFVATCLAAAIGCLVMGIIANYPIALARFLPHLNSSFMSERMKGNWEDRLIELPDRGQVIQLGESKLVMVPAHFLHSVGNFQFYDPVAKILFSGDMGASIVVDASQPLKDFDAHVMKMKAFHQRYMCSNKVIRLWVNMVRQMDIEMIVPQHGTPFIGKEIINQFLDWIETLPCGVDLMTEQIFSCPT
ncbi:MBL fold metallo-hydrolase [Acinetobacter nosocomialis]|nr:MBL fold metallo-hydrolase [Acinetobacter nosocomialis]